MVEVLKRKRVLAGLGAVVALVAAGAAIAYFTSTGSGNGTGSVGNASNWTVAIAAPSGGPLYPGAGSQTFAYTVTNASSGHQQLQATASSVLADANGDITHNGTAGAGCKAAWFTAANTAPAAANLAGGAATSGSVLLTMQDSNTDQNACQAASPDIQVNAS